MIGIPTSFTETPHVEPNSCLTDAGFSVYYLYPDRCVECERNIPETCEACESYYDKDMLALVSGDIGLPVSFVVSDAVSEATVFVVSGQKSFLGVAKSKVAIAQIVCAASENEEACTVFADAVDSVKKCFAGYGINAGTLVYQYADDCAHCELMKPVIEELESLSFGETGYVVHRIDDGDGAETRILTECVGGLLELRYIPNIICPANARSIVGEQKLGDLRDFADDCIEAASIE